MNEITISQYNEAKKIVVQYEEQQKALSYAMFEIAGCRMCSRGQLYSGGGSELSITYYTRCECANIKTKRYATFLENADNMLVKDFNIEKSKFYDNNRHIVVGNNSVDRSW